MAHRSYRGPDRYGSLGAGPLKPFKSGVTITSPESVPASKLQCAEVPGREVEFVIRKPVDVTAFTIFWGRWVELEGGTDGWLELGSQAFASTGTPTKLFRIPEFETHGDAVAIYLSAVTGTPASTFLYYVRDIP